MKKFLLALQFWGGDRDDAIALLELLADTIEENNPWADLCIFSRFDAKPIPEELVYRLQKVFSKVWEKKSKTKAFGWPDGCNAMWADLAMECYINSSKAFDRPAWQEYKACFSIESDCCPLTKDWLEVISREWDSSNAAVLGAWQPSNEVNPEIGHINGNMLFAIDLNKRLSVIASPSNVAWDIHYAEAFNRLGWAESKKIISLWGTKSLTEKQMRDMIYGGYVFLHGVKDSSARAFYKAQ